MPTGSHIVIVGESNPHGESPDHALYCWPVNSAGWRLQSKIMGVSRATYIGFHRHNLCVGQWSTPTAREEAQQLLKLYADQTDYTLILLGRKVVEAFFCGPGALDKQGAPKPFTRDFLRYSVLGGHTTVRERENLVILPHPSGRCSAWNEPGTYERARALLREACPSVTWGRVRYTEKLVDVP